MLAYLIMLRLLTLTGFLSFHSVHHTVFSHSFFKSQWPCMFLDNVMNLFHLPQKKLYV